MKGYAVAVPLPVWQDPQGNLRVTISDGGAAVSFDCWTDAGEEADYAGRLIFESVWAARVIRSEFVPYQIDALAYQHYVVAGHDEYAEFVARSYRMEQQPLSA